MFPSTLVIHHAALSNDGLTSSMPWLKAFDWNSASGYALSRHLDLFEYSSTRLSASTLTLATMKAAIVARDSVLGLVKPALAELQRRTDIFAYLACHYSPTPTIDSLVQTLSDLSLASNLVAEEPTKVATIAAVVEVERRLDHLDLASTLPVLQVRYRPSIPVFRQRAPEDMAVDLMRAMGS